MTSEVILGVLASLALQWAKTSPSFPWLTEENTKTLQALAVLFAALVGIVVAAQQPGGLAKLDWGLTLQTIFNSGSVVLAAIWLFYRNVIRPHEVKPSSLP